MSSLYQCGFDCGRVIAICAGSRRDQSRATAEMAIARVAERVKQGGGMIFPKWSFAIGLRQDGKISRIIVNRYILGFYTITPAVNPS